MTSNDLSPLIRTVEIPVRYEYDPETGYWNFVIDSPSILGGWCRSREQAEAQAIESVARMLAGHGSAAGAGDMPDLGVLRVEISPVPSMAAVEGTR